MNFTPDVGWYYINADNRSPSWTGVEFLYNFLTENKIRGPFGREVPISEALPGDVIQLTNGERFYHSLFIVRVGSTPSEENVLINANSMNAYRRPLSSYDASGYRVIHIDGVYL